MSLLIKSRIWTKKGRKNLKVYIAIFYMKSENAARPWLQNKKAGCLTWCILAKTKNILMSSLYHQWNQKNSLTLVRLLGHSPGPFLTLWKKMQYFVQNRKYLFIYTNNARRYPKCLSPPLSNFRLLYIYVLLAVASIIFQSLTAKTAKR